MPKSLFFAVFYSVSLTSTYCLKTPKSLQIQISNFPLPQPPPPAKPTGEKLKAIFIAFRHPPCSFQDSQYWVCFIRFHHAATMLFTMFLQIARRDVYYQAVKFHSMAISDPELGPLAGRKAVPEAERVPSTALGEDTSTAVHWAPWDARWFKFAGGLFLTGVL